jgi:hypothetical protein
LRRERRLKLLAKGSICQADIQVIDAELQAQGLYGPKESDVARMCLALISVGARKRIVKMLSAPEITKEKFDLCWRNLQKNGYFSEDKTINLEDLEDSDIPFILMMKIAEGQIERKEV